MKPVLCVFGTRSEAVKMAPVVRRLCKTQALDKLAVTARHRAMAPGPRTGTERRRALTPALVCQLARRIVSALAKRHLGGADTVGLAIN